jgi:CspA family cold shock protein
MPIGTVKFFKDGYGFLAQDHSTTDMFVHVSEVRRAGYDALIAGQRARYEVGANPKNGRRCAVEVELLEPIISPANAWSEQDMHGAHVPIAQSTFMQR